MSNKSVSDQLNKGISLDDLGRYSEAIECYDKCLEIDKNHKEAWNNKGNTLNNLGRYSEAIECFDKCLEIDNNFPIVWFNKALSYLLKQDLEKVQACLNIPGLKEYDHIWYHVLTELYQFV